MAVMTAMPVPWEEEAVGIPKLSAKKHKGHAVHDAEQLTRATPKGYRRGGRASVRGEMRGAVLGNLEKEETIGSRSAASGRNQNPPPPVLLVLETGEMDACYVRGEVGVATRLVLGVLMNVWILY